MVKKVKYMVYYEKNATSQFTYTTNQMVRITRKKMLEKRGVF